MIGQRANDATTMMPLVSTEDLQKRALRQRAPLYIGAVTNRINFGDDLLFAANEALLNVELGYLPLGGRNRLLRVRRTRGVPALVLGGGTLIGRPAYRKALQAGMNIGGAESFSMLSAGVSAPNNTGKSSLDELEAWKPVLEKTRTVRVRGPRSKEHLQRVGIESRVVGDPVLAFLRGLQRQHPDRSPQPSDSPTRIAVNVADVDGIDRVIEETVHALIAVVDRVDNPMISIMSAAPYDDSVSARLAIACTKLHLPTELVPLYQLDYLGLVEQLERHKVMLAVRLHAAVSAAAVGLPAVSIAYEDKCWDHQLSIGAGPWTLDLANVEREPLSQILTSLIVDPSLQRRATEPQIERLIDAQHAAAQRVAGELQLARAA